MKEILYFNETAKKNNPTSPKTVDFDIGVNAVFWFFFLITGSSLMIELNNSHLEILIEFCRIEGPG